MQVLVFPPNDSYHKLDPQLSLNEQYLQDVGQFRITIGNMFVLLCFRERMNAVTQGRERLIDLLGLLQGLASGTSLANLLRTSQIHKIELSCLCGSIFCLLLHRNNETTFRKLIYYI